MAILTKKPTCNYSLPISKIIILPIIYLSNYFKIYFFALEQLNFYETVHAIHRNKGQFHY